MAAHISGNRLVWVDLETTGLDAQSDEILEMVLVVTDNDLNVICKSPSIVIHHPDDVITRMGVWCQNQHRNLIPLVRTSTVTTRACEVFMINFLRNAGIGAGELPPLCGSSVHFDQRFLIAHMPELMKLVHFRIVDVSTINILARRWAPAVASGAPRKKYGHRAGDDIDESINELRWYRSVWLRPTPPRVLPDLGRFESHKSDTSSARESQPSEGEGDAGEDDHEGEEGEDEAAVLRRLYGNSWI